MAKAVMFLGTGSDVGKSIVATAFCRIAKRRGFRVAPFKAQNMSNNSFVTVEGGEIGRAQVVQAEAAGLLPSVHMNPILLKPSSHRGSQVVLQGKVYGTLSALNYYELKPHLKDVVMASYSRLSREYDLIIMEGAGSCCEMNLKQTDLVNFAMAKEAGAPCILIGDIDRGGVFAQIIGSFYLMTPEERGMTRGFLINKFRGDPALFATGMRFIEEKTNTSGLGLIPFYTDILIDPEDSVAVQEDKRALKPIGPRTVNIAVLKLGAISNFTDMERLEKEKDVVLNYLVRPGDLSPDYDWLILPGTKNTMEDALWVARSGWKKEIKRFVSGGGRVLGICGGYQLLGEAVRDPSGVESENRMVRGLGILPIETVLEGDKIVRKVTGISVTNQMRVKGYEIHMGRTRILSVDGSPFLRIHEPGRAGRVWEDGWTLDEGRVAGTYVHGILDSPGFRADMVNRIRRAKGLKERPPGPGRLARFHQYDRLADHFEAHCNVDAVLSHLG